MMIFVMKSQQQGVLKSTMKGQEAMVKEGWQNVSFGNFVA